MDVEMDFIWQT